MLVCYKSKLWWFLLLLGTEKWDEVPRWKKDSNNEFSDKKSSSTLGFEESPNNRYKL